jgi:hypothetical protein
MYDTIHFPMSTMSINVLGPEMRMDDMESFPRSTNAYQCVLHEMKDDMVYTPCFCRYLLSRQTL